MDTDAPSIEARSDPISEGRRLEAAATPGPWTGRGPRIYYAQCQEVLAESDMLNRNHGLLRVETTGRARSWAADAALLVHLRNHATDYFDAVEALGDLDNIVANYLGREGQGDLFMLRPKVREALSRARAVLARLREPAKQGSGDEEGEL